MIQKNSFSTPVPTLCCATQMLRLFVAAMLLGGAGLAAAGFESEYEEKRWEEVAAQLPSFPQSEQLLPFVVSAASDNKFTVDADSISVGTDGVVRYTLVVVSTSGAKNISYEGIRCSSAERRLYAFGRSDGSWSKARSNQWVRIQESTLNRQHAALFFEYFCPNGIVVNDAEEARRALRAGGHPATIRR